MKVVCGAIHRLRTAGFQAVLGRTLLIAGVNLGMLTR
jgi:hypothetical protein